MSTSSCSPAVRLTVLGLAAAALGVPAAPALATQPGRNGPIAFSQVVDGHRQLFTIEPDGRGLRQVTRFDGDATQPAWSPDGRRLAFTTARVPRPRER